MALRNFYNAIRALTLRYEIVCTDAVEMEMALVEYFQYILAPESLPILSTPLQWFIDLQTVRCNLQLQNQMTSLPTTEEIYSILRKLNPNKTPRPDGLTSDFYKSVWLVVGEEFLQAIIMFFATVFLPRAANAITLSLVPKKHGATSISDYRHVALGYLNLEATSPKIKIYTAYGDTT